MIVKRRQQIIINVFTSKKIELYCKIFQCKKFMSSTNTGEFFNVVVPGHFNTLQPVHIQCFNQLTDEISNHFSINPKSKIRFHFIIYPQYGFDLDSVKMLLSGFSFCSTSNEYNEEQIQNLKKLNQFYLDNYKININCIVEFDPNFFANWPSSDSFSKTGINYYKFIHKHPDFASNENLFMRRFSPSLFTDQPVSDEIIKEAVEAARRAPSAGNLQAYSLILIKNKQKLQEICNAALQQGIITNSAGVFAFVIEKEQSAAKYRSRGRTLYALQDATIACSHLQLTLESFGVQSRWIGAFRDEEMRNILDVGDKDIAGLLVFGYGKQSHHRSKRRNIDSYFTVIP